MNYAGDYLLDGEWHTTLPRYSQLVDIVEGKKILDIGCGAGVGSSFLLEQGAKSVHAIDHRPGVITIAKMRHEKEGLSFHEMFLEDLEFPDDVFDIVLCLGTETPVTDSNLLVEIERVMKKNGTYICAIECNSNEGLENILPQYGYSDSGERLHHNPTGKPIPQIGNLEERFPTCHKLIQRPVLSYVFEEENTTAKVKEQIHFENSSKHAVALWFCGNKVKKPKSKEVFLPYFDVVERLQHVFSSAYQSQNERADFAEPYQREHQATSEFRVVSLDEINPDSPRDDLGLDEPTTVRQMPSVDLSMLYSQMKNDFQTVVSQAQNALQERDQYISHLVETVHGWEQRFRNNDEPQTGEFDVVEDLTTTTEHPALKREREELKSDSKKKTKTTKKQPSKKKATKKTTKKTTKKKTTKAEDKN